MMGSESQDFLARFLQVCHVLELLSCNLDVKASQGSGLVKRRECESLGHT